VRVVDAPAQIEVVPPMLKLGAAFTVIVFDTIAVQPLELVPVHEYVEVELGLTVILDEVAPVLHK